MEFKREMMLERFPWLEERDQHFIISADYDGIICASFLYHTFGWRLAGYYDLNNLWISTAAMEQRENLIWVDLNILPRQGRAIGGHIVSLGTETPPGFESSCNPNLLAGLTERQFSQKYPFSTILYLLWLHNQPVQRDLMARLLVLQADAVWLKCQHYPENTQSWQKYLSDYEWSWLLQKVDTALFDQRVDQLLIPVLNEIKAVSSLGKLQSKHRKIRGTQYQFNPDWDEDIVLSLLELFGRYLKWTPPRLPEITHRITGKREKLPLAQVKKTGLENFLKKNKVFSYAITGPRTFNYTTFGYRHRSPLEKCSVKGESA